MKQWEDLTRLGRARRLRSLARQALGSYDTHISSLRLLADETNTLFLARDQAGEGFVVRVGLGGPIAHTFPEVQAETAWLAALARDTGLQVSRPVPDRRGRLVNRIGFAGVPEERNVVVFRWIGGTLLDDQLTPANLEAYGGLAASLHGHAGSYRPPEEAPLPHYDRLFPFDEPEVLFLPGREDLLPPDRRAVFAEAAARVEAAIDRLRTREPMRLLHGDLHIWNVLVTRQGVAAIDFEDLMWGWPVQDLATALYYLQGRPDFDRIRTTFRTGYEQVAPWPEQTPGEIDTFMAGRALVLANDVQLMLDDPAEDIDGPAFFARAERRLRSVLHGEPFRDH